MPVSSYDDLVPALVESSGEGMASGIESFRFEAQIKTKRFLTCGALLPKNDDREKAHVGTEHRRRAAEMSSNLMV
ncbi:hypothetical protein GCK72_019374 [Caenorhabditis remanei]|uniref:Uncharacterized protein n=1 Tax=Caenorhabditis remanei TaxID=31234 RepID=A0A6A5GEF5_CAERE|nr:hypothetical protein GCK72_019374 [Caenorhabditis remanei]KAF1752819.1 hypothetical protein GCK72_019374 [Caenorhabditis remanei]